VTQTYIILATQRELDPDGTPRSVIIDVRTQSAPTRVIRLRSDG
jgi:hypothetical protein